MIMKKKSKLLNVWENVMCYGKKYIEYYLVLKNTNQKL